MANSLVCPDCGREKWTPDFSSKGTCFPESLECPRLTISRLRAEMSASQTARDRSEDAVVHYQKQAYAAEAALAEKDEALEMVLDLASCGAAGACYDIARAALASVPETESK